MPTPPEPGQFIPPPAWGWPPGIGVFVGGCVAADRPRTAFTVRGHAHIARSDPRHGWICIRYPRHVFAADGGPSVLMLHELAHVVTGQSHTAAWRDKLRELGVNPPPFYSPGTARPTPLANPSAPRHATLGDLSRVFKDAGKTFARADRSVAKMHKSIATSKASTRRR